MRAVEEIKHGVYREVVYVRHEARTHNEGFDIKLRRLLRKTAHAGLLPIGTLMANERFWEYWIHPDDESKYQTLIKEKINGIHFIE